MFAHCLCSLLKSGTFLTREFFADTLVVEVELTADDSVEIMTGCLVSMVTVLVLGFNRLVHGECVLVALGTGIRLKHKNTTVYSWWRWYGISNIYLLAFFPLLHFVWSLPVLRK